DHMRLLVAAGEKPIDVSVFLAAGDADRAAVFKKVAASLPVMKIDLADIQRGGPAHYKPIVTKIQPATNKAGPFAVDVLPTPTANPWRALIRPGGIDLFQCGKRAAL